MKDPQSVQVTSELPDFLAPTGRRVVKKTMSKSLRSEVRVKAKGLRPGRTRSQIRTFNSQNLGLRPFQYQLQPETNYLVVSVSTNHLLREASFIFTTVLATSRGVSNNSSKEIDFST